MSSREPWKGHELALATVGERELEKEKDTDTDHPSSRDKYCAYPSQSSGSNFISCMLKTCVPLVAKHVHNTHTPTRSDRVLPAKPFSANHNETAQHESAHWRERLCAWETEKRYTTTTKQ